MNLHRSRTDPKVEGNRLVGQPFDQPIQHIALPIGQHIQPRARILRPRARATVGDRHPPRRFDTSKQRRLLERFFYEVARPCLHRRHRHVDVAMAGHDHHRQHDAPRAQLPLHLQSVNVGHPHVQQHASRFQSRRFL